MLKDLQLDTPITLTKKAFFWRLYSYFFGECTENVL